MALSWSGRRQFLYYIVAAVILFFVAVGIYQAYFTAPPTCFDNKENGGEHGIDCGGPCSLVCTNEAHPLTVLWARTFAVALPSAGQPGTYTAAAYVQSDNLSAGAKAVPYSFQLFDSQNSLIVERDGVVDIPPIEVMPIIETNIPTGTRAAARVLFAFGGTPTWHTASVAPLSVSNENLLADGTRLSATINNDTLLDVTNVTIDAVLFDSSGTSIAASKTVVSVPKKGSQPVVFTWPGGVKNVARAEITVLPPF